MREDEVIPKPKAKEIAFFLLLLKGEAAFYHA
jgi:hypothetical protein